MKRTSLLLLLALFFMGACKQADKDKEIAADMCGCFNLLKDSLPPGANQVFEKIAAAPNASEAFATEMKSMDPEMAMKISGVLMSTGKEGSPTSECLKELDKKYKTSVGTQQEAATRMVAALKDKKGCDLMMALMKISASKK